MNTNVATAAAFALVSTILGGVSVELFRKDAALTIANKELAKYKVPASPVERTEPSPPQRISFNDQESLVIVARERLARTGHYEESADDPITSGKWVLYTPYIQCCTVQVASPPIKEGVYSSYEECAQGRYRVANARGYLIGVHPNETIISNNSICVQVIL